MRKIARYIYPLNGYIEDTGAKFVSRLYKIISILLFSFVTPLPLKLWKFVWFEKFLYKILK